MNLEDRVFIALLATLFLAVIAVEWRNRWRNVPQHVKPPPGGMRLLERINVPPCRDGQTIVENVGDMNVETAAKGEFQS